MRKKVGMENVNCNLCSADDSRLIYKKENYSVVRCKKCGLTYINPRPDKNELIMAVSGNFYRQHFIPITFNKHENYQSYKGLLDGFKKYFRIGRLLDVGCASGLFLAAAKEEGWEVKGVDISEPAVGYGSKKLGLDIFLGELEEASYPDEYFDVIICRDTIEHIQDPCGLLNEANRILRKKGLIFISTPNFNGLTRLFLMKEWSNIMPGHLYYFTNKTATKMLKINGFGVLKRLTINIDPHEILLGGILRKDFQKKPVKMQPNSIDKIKLGKFPACAVKEDIPQNRSIKPSNNIVNIIQSNRLPTQFKRLANLIFNLFKTGDKLIIYAEKYTSTSSKNL